MPKKRHTYALFDTPDAATAAYDALSASGCSSEHCSAILHQRHIDETLLGEGESASPEGARRGAILAGTSGAIIGGLVALGGGIVGVGPLIGLAFGGGVMSVWGALLGAIASSEDPERHLRALEGEVEAGKILIAVSADEQATIDRASEILAEHGGELVDTED
ncbi:MAG: DUF1269 domain-containing protein [Myxococcales bacterium]|nr:DUF1269 domain-containing protein [Myxococcales bacterium]